MVHANLIQEDEYSISNSDSVFRQNYAKALDGDSKSQLIIGKIFLEGKGNINANVQLGFSFLTKSINAENTSAAIYLAKNYEHGKFLTQNDCKALNYYEKAKELGAKKINNKILDLSQKCRGSVSAKSCALYSLNDLSRPKTLAQCAENGFIKASASKYWLVHFDKGNSASLIKAASQMANPNSKYFEPMEIINRLPKFFLELATDEQKTKFQSIIRSFGHDSESCKNGINALGLPELGDPPSCFLSAAAEDFKAMEFASSWWMNGKHGVNKNKEYGDYLLKTVIKNNPEDLNIESLLKALENEPRKHFTTAMEYLNDNPFNRDRVSSSLSLEMDLISTGNIPDFAKKPSEVALVLETADWNAQKPETIATVLYKLQTDYIDFNELKSQSIKQNINKLQFIPAWMNELVKIDLSQDKIISKNVLQTFTDKSCLAFRFGINNIKLVNKASFIGLPNRRECLPFKVEWITPIERNDPDFASAILSKYLFESCEAINFGLQNTSILNQEALNMSPIYDECLAKNINVEGDSLFNFAENPGKSVAILTTKFKGDLEDQCEPFLIYLQNREVYSKIVDADKFPDIIKQEEETKYLCSEINGGIAGFIAREAFTKKDYGISFSKAEQACEMKDYDSCGLAAHIALNHKIPQNKNLDKFNQKKKARKIAERGYRVGNSDISGLVLYDIMTSGSVNIPSQSSKNKLDDLLRKLTAKSASAVNLRKQGSCLRSLFKKCSDECFAIDRIVDNEQLDFISLIVAKKYQKSRKCR